MTDDAELLFAAKESIGRTHGLSAVQSARLVGGSAQELHADAKKMAGELGVRDPSERVRDDAGRYTGNEHADVNRLIREASGR